MSLMGLEGLLGPQREAVIQDARRRYHEAFSRDLHRPGACTVRVPEELVWAEEPVDLLQAHIAEVKKALQQADAGGQETAGPALSLPEAIGSTALSNHAPEQAAQLAPRVGEYAVAS